VIEFHLETQSGVPTYLQIVQQVRQAIRLGVLRPGDQLPTVKDVVGTLTVNPNTVLKAYRDLDREGLVEGRRGVGTFVAEDVAPLPPGDVQDLRSRLEGWITRARRTGLDDESMAALFMDTLRPPAIRSVA
jgi:DNA-binding transcriptional regulator YhcF (GntR family)